jgi:hypothetical protein
MKQMEEEIEQRLALERFIEIQEYYNPWYLGSPTSTESSYDDRSPTPTLEDIQQGRYILHRNGSPLDNSPGWY